MIDELAATATELRRELSQQLLAARLPVPLG